MRDIQRGPPPTPIQKLSDAQLAELAAYILRYKMIESYFPEMGPLRRELYPKHMAFMAAGAKYRQRMFMAANRVGKTETGCCELTYHLTGEYPEWWLGHRFTTANEWWVCGKDTQSVRDYLQSKLLGPVNDFGSGFIPKHLLNKKSMTSAKKGETLVSFFEVKHVPTGQWSQVMFKTYDSGRKSFEGASKNIWLDEEPPLDIYEECLTRTTKTDPNEDDKILLTTFTPLAGTQGMVEEFLEGQGWEEGPKGSEKWLSRATIYDVPHIPPEEKERLEKRKGKDRNARIFGIPSLGQGLVYDFEEEDVFEEPFEIPDHWRRCMAWDFGTRDPSAGLWAAIDPDTKIMHIYAEHYQTDKPPSFHAAVINVRDDDAGFRIPKCCDPSGGGLSVKEGKTARQIYAVDHKIYFVNAENAIGAGISKVMDELAFGRIKVFKTCRNFKNEFQLYHYDKNGDPKGRDHLMDCLRYLVLTGAKFAKSLQQIASERNAALRHPEGRRRDPLYDHPDWYLYT